MPPTSEEQESERKQRRLGNLHQLEDILLSIATDTKASAEARVAAINTYCTHYKRSLTQPL